MKQRVIWGVIASLVLLPFLLLEGLSSQVFAGLLAMIGVAEMLRMRRLEFFSIEGVLAMLGASILTVPLNSYFTSLPLNSSFSVYGLPAFLLLAGTVLNGDDCPFDGVSYPTAASLYTGIGLRNLTNARINGLDEVLLALFIVWATNIGAYMIGRRSGRRKSLPKVSPDKAIKGSLGGIVCAIIVALIFMLVDKAVYTPHNLFAVFIYVVLFSIFGRFGDLVESTIKRHFDMKDSDKLIPGHGDILGHFDSMTFVFLIMHLLGLFQFDCELALTSHSYRLTASG